MSPERLEQILAEAIGQMPTRSYALEIEVKVSNAEYHVKGFPVMLGDLKLQEEQMEAYITTLRAAGVDIWGRDKAEWGSESEWGYSFPLPKKGDTTRKLVIYRRHDLAMF